MLHLRFPYKFKLGEKFVSTLFGLHFALNIVMPKDIELLLTSFNSLLQWETLEQGRWCLIEGVLRLRSNFSLVNIRIAFLCFMQCSIRMISALVFRHLDSVTSIMSVFKVLELIVGYLPAHGLCVLGILFQKGLCKHLILWDAFLFHFVT